jgi:hypothetical protein
VALFALRRCHLAEGLCTESKVLCTNARSAVHKKSSMGCASGARSWTRRRLAAATPLPFAPGESTHHSPLHKGFRGISSLRLRYSTVPCAFTPDAVFRPVPKGNGR